TLLSFSPAAGDPLEMKTLVQQELIRRGILWSGIHNLCHEHGPAEIDYTLKAFAAVLSILKQAVEAKNIASRLQGGLLQPVFRKTSAFDTKPKPI
ncbi:MAG: aminotransferase class III-fold pyridoxal phosphate-dependent enzyme, partial [Nitrososphaera sp.]